MRRMTTRPRPGDRPERGCGPRPPLRSIRPRTSPSVLVPLQRGRVCSMCRQQRLRTCPVVSVWGGIPRVRRSGVRRLIHAARGPRRSSVLPYSTCPDGERLRQRAIGEERHAGDRDVGTGVSPHDLSARGRLAVGGAPRREGPGPVSMTTRRTGGSPERGHRPLGGSSRDGLGSVCAGVSVSRSGCRGRRGGALRGPIVSVPGGP